MSDKKSSQGFTFLEVLIVIAIVFFISAVVYVFLSGVFSRARDVKRKSDLSAIQAAIDSYYFQKGRYPEAEKCALNTYTWINWSSCNNNSSPNQDIVALLEGEGYIKKILSDTNKQSKQKSYYEYGYQVWPSGADATYYLCSNLEKGSGAIQYAGYNYCVRGGCTSCH